MEVWKSAVQLGVNEVVQLVEVPAPSATPLTHGWDYVIKCNLHLN